MYKWATQCYKACLELPTQLECWASILAWTSGITRTSELSPLAPAALYPQWNFFALISARGWVGPRATVRRQKEYVTWKFPRTLPGIEPGTVRVVVARPNSCYLGNNTQAHSILWLLFLPDTVSQCPVTEHNSLCRHGPVTVFFDISHFRSEGRLLPMFVDTYICAGNLFSVVRREVNSPDDEGSWCDSRTQSHGGVNSGSAFIRVV